MEEKHHTEHKHHESHMHHSPHDHSAHHGHKSSSTKLLIMVIALGLLIIISGVQAFELISLKNKLNEDLSEVIESGTGKKTISTGSGSLSDNLNNLPTMVGGC